MSEIKMIPLNDIEALYELRRDTYPSIIGSTNESREQGIEKLHKIQHRRGVRFYGYYDQNELQGGMRLFDFTMNLYGRNTLVGGIGSVSVNLLHKKEKIAKKLVESFIQSYREKGASFVFLYAFRHDFYKKMGFGYGTRSYEYQVCPSSFPRGKSKQHLMFAGKSEMDLLLACSHREAEKNHGMIERMREHFETYVNDENKKIIAYKKGDSILGYLVFSPERVERQNLLVSNFVIHEWVYENADVLREFITFLHSQADQFERVIFETQDRDFFYLLDDPRNHRNRVSASLFHESHIAGVGMMVRVIDPRKAIMEVQNRQFGIDSFVVHFKVIDEFLGETTEVNIAFRDGRCALSDERSEVEITIDIAEYSSLLFGSISFEKLYRYGLLSLSDEAYAERLIDLFGDTKVPMCTVLF